MNCQAITSSISDLFILISFFAKVFLIEPVFVVWGPIAERFLGSIRYFQPPARGRAGATKKEDRTATQKKNYGSCPKKNGRQIPVKQQCTDSCWDWRAVGRSLVWPRWIPCRKESLSFYILWSLSNSTHPWIFTLGVKAGLKDSISRQKASSISSSLRTEMKCIFMGNVLLSSNLIVYIQNTWEGSCWTYWAEPRCWTQELRQEFAFSPMAQTKCFCQTRRSTIRRLCTGWCICHTI